ncbi:MAG: iron-sulfur cluster insertion protein ErpA [Puniceicoccaceae bacterium]|nr:MAG: iron-sulfur cluster insertion protein ErpA [Puniceicoccaceae bacterium]
MISFTQRAAAQVKTLHAQLGDDTRMLRVFIESGGCSGFQYGMAFDERKPDDQVMESEGISFLIDPASLAYLDGSEIDFDDGLQGKGFEVRNPNAQSSCGCGKSFN